MGSNPIIGKFRGYDGQVADCGLQQGEGSISDNIDMSAKMERPLVIPVILGTARQGRQSENVARFVFEQTKKRADVETELIDVRALPMRLDDAGEQMKDAAFSATIERCDGIILVVPEYNHGYPGLLKHALDMNLKEYIHTAGGMCGVSARPVRVGRVCGGLRPLVVRHGLGASFG